MHVSINYPNGGGFSVAADDDETLLYLYNLAQKTLWGNNAKALTIEQMDDWLGWTK